MTRMNTLAAIVFAASISSLNASAGNIDPAFYGTPAPAGSAGRVIDITARTVHVNVVDGETVTFRLDGRQFTWTFHVDHGEGVLALASILPQEVDAHGIKVYVAQDPSYR